MADTVKEIIPQFFYDILARVLPGFVTIVIVFLAFSIPLNKVHIVFQKDYAVVFNFSGFLVVCIVSYFVAIVLSGISSLLVKIYYLIRSLFRGKEENIMPALSKKFTRIRLESSEVGFRILKLRAEWHMAKLLTLAFAIGILCTIYTLFIYPNESSKSIAVLVIYLLSMLGATTFRRMIRRGYIGSIENNWEIFGGKTPAKPPEEVGTN